MAYVLSPYTIAQTITAVVSIITASIIWRRRSSRGGWLLFLLFVAVSEWALANGLEAAATAQETKIFWSKVGYFGAQISPVLIFLFALRYTGKNQRLSPVTIGLLFIIPALIIFLAATNESHGLIWISFSPGPAGSNSLIYHHGPAFWLGIAYIFSMVAFATTFFIISAVKSQKIFRLQNLIILIATLLPWIGSLMYFLEISPFPGLDTVSVSFFFTGLLLLFGISKGNLMEVIPVANDLIMENIDEGILVVDDKYRIIDLNPAAEELLSLKFNQVFGKNIQSDANLWKSVEKYFPPDKNCRFEIESPRRKDSWLAVSISPLLDRQKTFLGWAVVLEVITHRKTTEKELQITHQKLERRLKDIHELQDQLREQAVRDNDRGF